jgi:hypothetical protein
MADGVEVERFESSVCAHIAQQVEHFLGKEEVIGSNPIVSTTSGVDRQKTVGNGTERSSDARSSATEKEP